MIRRTRETLGTKSKTIVTFCKEENLNRSLVVVGDWCSNVPAGQYGVYGLHCLSVDRVGFTPSYSFSLQLVILRHERSEMFVGA